MKVVPAVSDEELRGYRNEIIEQCARVADDHLNRKMGLGGKAGPREIAIAIRALKDKP